MKLEPMRSVERLIRNKKRNKEEDYIKIIERKRLSIKIPQNAFEPSRVFKKRL
jgi:hypothetical protein